jgi:hypothetical protein
MMLENINKTVFIFVLINFMLLALVDLLLINHSYRRQSCMILVIHAYQPHAFMLIIRKIV